MIGQTNFGAKAEPVDFTNTLSSGRGVEPGDRRHRHRLIS